MAAKGYLGMNLMARYNFLVGSSQLAALIPWGLNF